MIRVLPLDFLGQGAMLTPVDPKLHDMAVKYCDKELASPVNLAEMSKVWVAVECDDNEQLVSVEGIMGYVLKPDVPVMRATNETALSMMGERLQSFFADNGCRGKEVLIHLCRNEKPEQRCPGWKNVLITEQKAEPADRFIVRVK